MFNILKKILDNFKDRDEEFSLNSLTSCNVCGGNKFSYRKDKGKIKTELFLQLFEILDKKNGDILINTPLSETFVPGQLYKEPNFNIVFKKWITEEVDGKKLYITTEIDTNRKSIFITTDSNLKKIEGGYGHLRCYEISWCFYFFELRTYREYIETKCDKSKEFFNKLYKKYC